MKTTIDFNVKVSEVSKGYKVVVSKKETSNTRNTRIGFDPLRFLKGNGGIRIYAGKKKQQSNILDNYEIVLDLAKWEIQLDHWCILNNLDSEVKSKIKSEINEIQIIRNI